MEVQELEEEPISSFMANINAINALRYEAFFTKHVFQHEDGKFAMYAEGKRVFLLLKWDNGAVIPFFYSDNPVDEEARRSWYVYFWMLGDGSLSRGVTAHELQNGCGSPRVRALQCEIEEIPVPSEIYDIRALQKIIPFLKDNTARFSCGDHGPRDVPQAKDRSDDVDALIRYQEAWIEMIEGAGEGDEYMQVSENTESIRASTKDGLSAVMNTHDTKRTEKV